MKATGAGGRSLSAPPWRGLLAPMLALLALMLLVAPAVASFHTLRMELDQHAAAVEDAAAADAPPMMVELQLHSAASMESDDEALLAAATQVASLLESHSEALAFAELESEAAAEAEVEVDADALLLTGTTPQRRRTPAKKPPTPRRPAARRPAPKPARRPAAKPARRPAAKPARRPAAKPARRPAAKPARRPARRPAAKPTRKPTRKPAKPAKSSRRPAAKPKKTKPTKRTPAARGSSGSRSGGRAGRRRLASSGAPTGGAGRAAGAAGPGGSDDSGAGAGEGEDSGAGAGAADDSGAGAGAADSGAGASDSGGGGADPTPSGNSVRERAYSVAAQSTHIREKGGNNRGAEVEEIIRANGGRPPEAWCGDFVAWCYRKAGSRRPNRGWASAFGTASQPGVSKTSSPQRGDLVIFKFSHIGIFVRDMGGGQIETIEGNTGSSGAARDSAGGGDGVHRRTRSKSQVKGFYTVSE